MSVINGTDGPDSIRGTEAADIINGLDGRDSLRGLGGDDEIDGGDGDDNIHGGDGNDVLRGGAGNDSLQGNRGTDIVLGMDGDDRLLFLDAAEGDFYDGGAGIDTLQFSAGLSTDLSFSVADSSIEQDLYGAMVVNVERLVFNSGTGDDHIIGGMYDDFIFGGDGNDIIEGGSGNDTLDGEGGIDTLYGGDGNDILRDVGGEGFGGNGDDTVYWSDNTQLLDGGAGSDLLYIEYPVFEISLEIDLSDPDAATEFFGTTIIGFESLNFFSGAGDDRLTGGIGDDLIQGNDGDDVIIGGLGNDNLSGAQGSDQLYGGEGDDFLHNHSEGYFENEYFDGGSGFDTLDYSVRNANQSISIDLLEGGGFVDNVERIWFSTFGATASMDVRGGNADDWITGGNEADHFEGRGGNDLINGKAGHDWIDGGDGSDFIDGEDGDDVIYGGAGDDNLRGGLGNDSLYGGDGNDELSGGFGTDYLEGGLGDDFYVVDDADDQLVEFANEGTDTILASLVDFTMPANFEHLIARYFSTEFAVTFTGNSLDNRILGGAGQDTLNGQDGNDYLAGDRGDDHLNGGDGSDQLIGGLGSDILDGCGNVDTAVMWGKRADYTVTQTSMGVFEVVGPDGTDILTAVEFLQFDDVAIRLLPGEGVEVNFNTADPSVYQSAMDSIRDFDGNVLGGNGSWLRIGQADVNGDGDIDQILVNDAIGRFATVGTAPDGLVYFDDHGWAGETRVAGTYIDPLVEAGMVEAGSEFDSQRRFQNDLEIENINRVLGADDYDGDGFQEVYFALTDGTAYLRALMHADGNIFYANYQTQEQVIEYLEDNGFGFETWGQWFPPPSPPPVAVPAAEGAMAAIDIGSMGEFAIGHMDEISPEFFG